MCERCRGVATEPQETKGRLKLWEVPSRFHCSVVGTCLSLEGLRRLLRRAGLRVAPDADDYSLHAFVVEAAGRPEPLTKLVHKALDAAWGPDVRRFSEAAPEDLPRLWAEAAAGGRIAGAYWGLLSRRGVPQPLLTEAYGTVHMLSHLLGGEARSGLKRLAQAERRAAELEAALGQARAAKAEADRERDSRIRALEARLRAAEAREPPQAPAPRDPARPTDAAGRADALAARLAETARRLRAERARARAAEAEAARLSELLGGPTGPGVRPSAPEGAGPETPGLEIEGKCVLFVGGRTGAIPRLRSLVERRKGRLLHHDGGQEQALRRLDGLVEQADLVVCPVDCVSHEACLRAKHLCRRLDKPFLPIRGHGRLFGPAGGRP
jgi:hypothetical protein